MKKFKTLLIVTVGILIVSCQSNTYEEISGGFIPNPTYSKDIQPIIIANCVSCHSVAGGEVPLLENYTQVKNACTTNFYGNGTVLCRIQGACGNIMPQSGKMNQVTIDNILRWSSQGYAN